MQRVRGSLVLYNNDHFGPDASSPECSLSIDTEWSHSPPAAE